MNFSLDKPGLVIYAVFNISVPDPSRYNGIGNPVRIAEGRVPVFDPSLSYGEPEPALEFG